MKNKELVEYNEFFIKERIEKLNTIHDNLQLIERVIENDILNIENETLELDYKLDLIKRDYKKENEENV